MILAILVLAAVAFAVMHYTPHSTADARVTRTDVYQSHVVFKSNSIVLNSDQAQDDLYVLATLRLTDRLRLPLFLKDFQASFNPGSPAETVQLSTSAIEKPDLANLFASFPALKKVAGAQGTGPLYRETKIDPGQTAEGYIVLHFPGTKDLWDKRQNATISIDLYHQAPLKVDIPNLNPSQP